MVEQEQISSIVSLISEFEKISEELDAIFDEKLIDPLKVHGWHQYYEISIGELLNKFINLMNFHAEKHAYIFSRNPIDTIIEISKKDSIKEPPEGLDLGEVLSILYALVKSFESVLYHQQTFHQLLKKIKNGFDTNDNILQKILQIDKTAMHCEPIQQRIQKAQLTHDKEFWGKLANTFRPRKDPEKSKDAVLTYLIFFIMDNGYFQHMPESQRVELLMPYKEPHITKESFVRKLYRISNLYY